LPDAPGAMTTLTMSIVAVFQSRDEDGSIASQWKNRVSRGNNLLTIPKKILREPLT
jgi:hypothetical protein